MDLLSCGHIEAYKCEKKSNRVIFLLDHVHVLP